jgi:Cytochrome P450
VTRLSETDRGALDDPNVVLNVVFLSTTSYDDTGLLHWIIKMLGDNPEWCLRIRRHPSLSRYVVQEALRLAQSEFISRRVTSDVEVDGYLVPKGWYLRVCIHESHRSAVVFQEPTRFDPSRFAARRYSRAEYAPFGMLEHVCLGVEATLQIGTAFVDAYCIHDWVLAADAALEFDGFHWRPSRKLGIALPAGDCRAWRTSARGRAIASAPGRQARHRRQAQSLRSPQPPDRVRRERPSPGRPGRRSCLRPGSPFCNASRASLARTERRSTRCPAGPGSGRPWGPGRARRPAPRGRGPSSSPCRARRRRGA